VGSTAAKIATYEDILALPEHVVGEILSGELIVNPRPAAPHAHASSVLGMDLGGAFQRGRGGPGGWWILDEPELHFGADILVPDLAGWRKSRLAEIPDDAFFTLAPDWVCEVISSGTAGIDRIKKLPVYAREGVGHVWLVDPKQHTLEVLQLTQGKWLLVGTHNGAERVRAEPFAEIELDLNALWISKKGSG